MSTEVLLLFRLLHIACGVFWVGAVTLVAFFVGPSVFAAGPAGGAVMRQLMEVRRMAAWLMGASAVTILSGFALYWHDSDGFQAAQWLGSGPGRVFGLGGVLAVAGLVVGMAVNVPAARRLGPLTAGIQAAGRPPSAEELAAIARLQRRLAWGSAVGAGLLLLATAAMAVARYV
ncbi:MAG TPA: hypothetical protein VHR43_16705 [Gemmatimonadales bacterium]|jgi:uncharacterized membrane protein|nr:hypothetical protein [Gemmatimonadales bacterium]